LAVIAFIIYQAHLRLTSFTCSTKRMQQSVCCNHVLRFIVSQEETGSCLVKLVTSLVRHSLTLVIRRLHSWLELSKCLLELKLLWRSYVVLNTRRVLVSRDVLRCLKTQFLCMHQFRLAGDITFLSVRPSVRPFIRLLPNLW